MSGKFQISLPEISTIKKPMLQYITFPDTVCVSWYIGMLQSIVQLYNINSIYLILSFLSLHRNTFSAKGTWWKCWIGFILIWRKVDDLFISWMSFSLVHSSPPSSWRDWPKRQRRSLKRSRPRSRRWGTWMGSNLDEKVNVWIRGCF